MATSNTNQLPAIFRGIITICSSIPNSIATDEDMTMLLAAQCHIGSKNCEVLLQFQNGTIPNG